MQGPPKIGTKPAHASLEYPQIDLTQLQYPGTPAPLQYPIPELRFDLPLVPQQRQQHLQFQQGAQMSETSYQHSIFSDATSLENDSSEGEQLEQRDFLMKDTILQLKSEMAPSLKQQQHKRFHKFYSAAMLPNPAVSKGVATYHKCPFCQGQFKNKSYLSRHMKKHDVVKDYKCPFFSPEHTKCHHLNGEFSRKDTFKAHLKSIHFIYPIGVSKVGRSDSGGRCAGCFKEYASNNDWVTQHIDTDECPGFAKNK